MSRPESQTFKEPLQNRLTVYRFGKKDGPMVLVATQDVGAGNAIAPVVAELAECFNVMVYAGDTSRKVWESLDHQLVETPVDYTRAVAELKPVVVIAGCSYSGPGIERKLTRQAKKLGTPTVWVIDSQIGIPTAASVVDTHTDVFPDYLCVPDEKSKQTLLETYPQVKDENVFVTGMPAFDRLIPMLKEREVIRERLRKQLGIEPDEKVFLFLGQLIGTSDTLASLIDALNMSPEISLIARFHPRDRDLASYQSVLSRYSGRLIDSSAIQSTEQLLLVADFVGSMYSTANLSAIYLQQPAIYLLQEASARNEMAREYRAESLPKIPAVELGAALAAFDVEQLRTQINDLLQGRLQQQILSAQKEVFRLTEPNAKKVAQAIKTIVSI